MNEIEKLKIEEERKFKEEKEKRIQADKRKRKIIMVVIIILALAVIGGAIYWIVTADERAEKAFDEQMLDMQNVIKLEKAKKAEKATYEYIGTKAESYKEKYATVYKTIEDMLGIAIDEDFYVLTDKNLLSLKMTYTGTYLVNYERELVFTLEPFETKKVTKYTTESIIDNFEVGIIYDKSGANPPKLYDGMKPVKYNEDTAQWEYLTNMEDSWYNYGAKTWANVMLDDTTEGAMDGSMYVWIPRFAYKINVDNYHKFVKGAIEIKFLKGTSNVATDGTVISESNTLSKGEFVIHPAFQAFGGLEGIWVSKYEASNLEYGSTGNKNEFETNLAELTYKSVVDRYSWTNIDLNNTYTVCLNMVNNPIYGLNAQEVNTHLMKNTEWGAVAYLTQSKYGRLDNEVWSNNYYDSIGGTKTGYGAKSAEDIRYGSRVGDETFAWNTEKGVKASTTGNVYGVYDMVGGSVERVAAYLNNKCESLSKFGLSLYNEANWDYVDVYYVNGADTKDSNYEAANKKYGDALYETSSSGSAKNTSWFATNSSMVNNDYPFFFRGGTGTVDEGSKAGLFYFSPSSGGTYGLSTFRAVITENRK